MSKIKKGKKQKNKEEITMENKEMFTEENTVNEEITNTENVEEDVIVETMEEVDYTANEVEEFNEEVNETANEAEETTNEVEEESEEDIKSGTIDGCKKLYVRKEPSKNSEPVSIVEEGSELAIDIIHSTDDFYKVITMNGIEGFCVKEYVKIN